MNVKTSHNILKKIPEIFRIALYGTKRFFTDFFRTVKADFLLLADQFKSFHRVFKVNLGAEHRYSFKISGIIAALGNTLRSHKKMFTTLFNYILPLTLLLACVALCNSEISKTYALEVTYNGKIMGTIKNETVYQDSISKVGKIIMASDENDRLLNTPTYKLVYARPSQMLDGDTMAENIISVSGDTFEDASGLFVDGEFIGAMKNGSDIRSLLDQLERSAAGHYGGGNAEIENELEVKSGIYPQESILSSDKLAEYLVGRSLESIQKNGYMVGGLISMRVTVTEKYTCEMPYETIEQAEEYYEVGYEKTEREGKKGKMSVTAVVTYIDGREVTRNIIESETLEEPVDEIKIIGSRMPDNAEKLSQIFESKFMWPLNGGYISSNFMSEERPNHKALDIASAAGTDIYASDSGTVSFAGASDDGAGLNIIIQHTDNFSTRYAHCSALYVTEGQEVTKGQIIAAVGKTGFATGNHLHFEVRYNGYRLDPLPFIKK